MNCDDNHLRRLIGELASLEPAMYSLGTPLLTDTPTTDTLVACGARALLALEGALSAGEPRTAMYAAYCLGLIGDAAALPALRAALSRYATKLPKEAFDFGVVSAAQKAIERLGGGSSP